MSMVEASFRKKKKAVGKSWRMDETYIKIKTQRYYLYKGVDPVDVVLKESLALGFEHLGVALGNAVKADRAVPDVQLPACLPDEFAEAALGEKPAFGSFFKIRRP